MDILSLDPRDNVEGIEDNYWLRGEGTYKFGPDITKKFLERNNLDLFIRSHEVCQMGWKWEHDHRCLTVFSAPNYCDRDKNTGVVLRINSDDYSKESIERSIIPFTAVHYPIVDKPLQPFDCCPFLHYCIITTV